MAELLLGPLLRYVGETRRPSGSRPTRRARWRCSAAARGRSTSPATTTRSCTSRASSPARRPPYEVALDGERRWPEPDSRRSRRASIRTLGGERPAADRLRLLPRRASRTSRRTRCRRTRTTAAARSTRSYALALRMLEQRPGRLAAPAAAARRPGLRRRGLARDARASSAAARHPQSRRARRSPTSRSTPRLYRESWGDPAIRWLLSTVPSAMIFDDHDVHDDWNTSAAWVEEMREAVVGGAHRRRLMSYWVYQHLGNLSPEQLRDDELLARGPRGRRRRAVLREFAAAGRPRDRRAAAGASAATSAACGSS